MVERSHFPSDFAWGVSTAAYQIEGATSEDGKGTSIWDTFARTRNAINDGNAAEIANDHYHRYAEDVDMVAGLGLNSYRFSIAWPRIQPTGEGRPNVAGLDFYKRLAERLNEKGIAPFATLYHWDLPQALEDRGGWLVRDTAERFADYTRIVVGELGDVIPNWTTLNEPWVASFLGYASGEHAPGKRVGAKAARAAYHLLLAHGLGAEAIREVAPQARLGVTLNLMPVVPFSKADADVDTTRRVDGLNNRFFLDPILTGRFPADVVEDLEGFGEWLAAQPSNDLQVMHAPIDFMGFNYYQVTTVAAAGEYTQETPAFPGVTWRDMNDGSPRTHMNWPIEPDGIISCVEMIHERAPELDVFVTENGAAFDDLLVDGEVHDTLRRKYLADHIDACYRAIARGLPLRGYFVWTLMDNFEWSYGYQRRFGIVRVDHRDQKRIIKDSGRWLSAWLGS